MFRDLRVAGEQGGLDGGVQDGTPARHGQWLVGPDPQRRRRVPVGRRPPLQHRTVAEDHAALRDGQGRRRQPRPGAMGTVGRRRQDLFRPHLPARARRRPGHRRAAERRRVGHLREPIDRRDRRRLEAVRRLAHERPYRPQRAVRGLDRSSRHDLGRPGGADAHGQTGSTRDCRSAGTWRGGSSSRTSRRSATAATTPELSGSRGRTRSATPTSGRSTTARGIPSTRAGGASSSSSLSAGPPASSRSPA